MSGGWRFDRLRGRGPVRFGRSPSGRAYPERVGVARSPRTSRPSGGARRASRARRAGRAEREVLVGRHVVVVEERPDRAPPASVRAALRDDRAANQLNPKAASSCGDRVATDGERPSGEPPTRRRGCRSPPRKRASRPVARGVGVGHRRVRRRSGRRGCTRPGRPASTRSSSGP